ncbi:nuclear transport factor 2 family protein [Micromonospora sp. WMMD1155]|uniref:nuclear transport factor 2 family protein n=1 Tax=Micromonospora sp. WMMD1155 TaxID=3016094 RepID=UPI00249C570F|nr:nuclear transport factor 2 family protein [Micromonospora sp. WMMD1155]WFE53429.1 nuclear transport factor 2 family protein [Micromonospora sp. WMMD1155]
MDRKYVSEWLAAYERVWRTPGTNDLVTLFTEDASYQQGPYWTPVVGLPAIAQLWEKQRKGPDEVFQMTTDIVAVEGDTAVSRQEVRYGDPVDQEYRDLWIMRFAEDGRCRAFEEWPFWPGLQPTASPDGS